MRSVHAGAPTTVSRHDSSGAHACTAAWHSHGTRFASRCPGLPPGYVDANEGSPLASGCTVLVYTLTSRAYGEWGADLVAALEREEASRGEAEVLVWDIDGDGDVSADEGEVMVQVRNLPCSSHLP